MELEFLGGLTSEKFLSEYWNKKPLLVKKAVKDIESFAEFDDFISMAQDEYFETRMVYEAGGEHPWQAKVGPFTKDEFKNNKGEESLWTLICHNLELLNSDFFNLKKKVNFIPDWNFDDVMATVSKKGASVGAHVDDYSVFIIQGKGKRKWLLEENPNQEYIEGLDIKLLKEFNPTIEWILEPGDMLYLPPNAAHHGISLEQSISYSLGFKSIRYKDLIDYHITQTLNNCEDQSYRDLKIIPNNDPFIIQDYVVENIFEDLLKIMSDKKAFKETFLKYLARPKNPIEALTEENSGDSSGRDDVLKNLKSFGPLKRDIWAKLVSSPCTPSGKNGSIDVAINDQLFNVSEETYLKLKKYFEKEAEEGFKIEKSDLLNKELISVLTSLIKNGVFYFYN